MFPRFKDDIFASDLAKIGSLSSQNRDVKYLICLVDVFMKYAWIKALKNRKVKIVINGFIEMVNKYKRQSNKLWDDQGK